jgi:disulfide bond formation protein DsbB
MSLKISLNEETNQNLWWVIFSLWLISLIATVGSLFFSEVLKYPPCLLCWYQRVCMYPLVLIFLTGLVSQDKSFVKFSLPQVVIGWGIALYHNLLYYKWIPENLAPCQRGISCTSVHIEWFGFITIPLLSWMAFSLILIILINLVRNTNEEST